MQTFPRRCCNYGHELREPAESSFHSFNEAITVTKVTTPDKGKTSNGCFILRHLSGGIRLDEFNSRRFFVCFSYLDNRSALASVFALQIYSSWRVKNTHPSRHSCSSLFILRQFSLPARAVCETFLCSKPN